MVGGLVARHGLAMMREQARMEAVHECALRRRGHCPEGGILMELPSGVDEGAAAVAEASFESWPRECGIIRISGV